ncbi:MAG: phosphatidate cytidylyltransferase, partial [Hyphomicrobiales bacterium]
MLVPVALAAVWFGGLAFAVFTAVVGVAVAWEWCRIAFGADGFVRYLPIFLGAALVAAFLGFIGLVPNYVIVLVAFYLTGIVLSLYRRSGEVRWVAFGVPYICAPLFALVSLRVGGDMGFACVLWLLMVVWVTDTAAFFTGRSLGGPKLAPAVSPNKTWSGACGGVLAAAILGYGFAVAWGLPGAFAVALVSA